MATGKPTHREPQPPCRAVAPQRLKRVLAAGGGEPAGRREQRTDEAAVADYGHDKEPRRQRRRTFLSRTQLRCAHSWRSAPTCRRSSRPRTRSRSAARSAWRAPAAAGCARNTSRQPPGSEATRLRISSRSRRFTRLRTTAEPTARLTTKPTFGPASVGTAPAGSSRAPATTALPARRPERSVRRNSSGLLIRVCCGSTTPPAQPRLPATGPEAPQWPSQTASCSRPLRRRAASTARPALVRIRRRKPWTFARRRLFGWNVRLLTGAPVRLKTDYGSGQIMPGATRPDSGRSTGPAAAAAVTWLSLLTVKGIWV